MNEAYLNRMQELLKEEYPAYLKAMNEPPYQAFRINTLKIGEDAFFSRYDLPHKPSPFASDSWYTNLSAGVGYMPAYQEGLFYMQEPSASAPVTVLDPKPGMKVLDLCAAPGSKTTEIAGLMKNTGLLVANETVSSRADILLENVERNGTANTYVLNSDTHTIARTFPLFFDAVLVDAPCSGEGMFRKNKMAQTEWSIENIHNCAKRQAIILDDAFETLNNGGVMVYSTCTFSREENEEAICSFLQRHPQMHIIPSGVSFGRHGMDLGNGTESSIRIYPMDGGEGQFMVKMQKDGIPQKTKRPLLKSEPLPSFVSSFLDDMLAVPYPYYYFSKDRLYGGTNPFIDCSRCHIKREQVYLGEARNGRFLPSHHFFMSSWSSFLHTAECSDAEIRQYMHGEQLSHPGTKGWIAISDHGHIIGGGKGDGKVIKNKYPKAFRTRS